MPTHLRTLQARGEAGMVQMLAESAIPVQRNVVLHAMTADFARQWTLPPDRSSKLILRRQDQSEAGCERWVLRKPNPTMVV